MTTAGHVHEARSDGLLTLTLARPSRRNALDPQMISALVESLERAAIDESLRGVLIRGEGDHFCSGVDWIGSNADGPRPRTGHLVRRVPLQANRVIELVMGLHLPVVAEVRGFAVGFGLALALAADFAIAAKDAVLWAPFTERGFTPDSGTTWLLPRLVGLARAKEVLMLGSRITGTEAADWGMVHRAVTRDALADAAGDLARHLCAGPTVALGMSKQLLHAGAAGSLGDAMTDELYALELAVRTKDFKEGLAAFGERREPGFTGR